MGAWADLTITAAALRGVVPVDLRYDDFGDVAAGRVTAEYLAAAKVTVETLALGGAAASIDGVSVYAAGLSATIQHLGGVAAFFDAAAASAELSPRLEHLVLHAFRWHYYGQERGGSDEIFGVKRAEAWADLVLGLRAFGGYAPMVLVDTTDPPTVRQATSRVVTVPANYGSGYG